MNVFFPPGGLTIDAEVLGVSVGDALAGVAEGAVSEVDVDVDVDTETAPALDIIPDACAGEIVCVDVVVNGCEPFPAFTS